MAIAAGRRDKIVTIQSVTEGTGSSGFPTQTIADLGTAFMSKQDVSGSERLASAQLQSPVDTEWGMVYQANMDPEAIDVPKTRQLVYQGRTYNIVRAVLEDRLDGYGIRLWTLAKTGV